MSGGVVIDNLESPVTIQAVGSPSSDIRVAGIYMRGKTGRPGKNPVFRKTSTYLQVKLEGEPDLSFSNLVPLADLKGEKGDPGDTQVAAQAALAAVVGELEAARDEAVEIVRGGAPTNYDTLNKLAQALQSGLVTVRNNDGGVSITDPQFAGGAVGGNAQRDTAALQAAAASGKRVYIPADLPALHLSDRIQIASETQLIAPQGAEIIATGAQGRMYSAINATDFLVSKIKFNGNRQNLSGTAGAFGTVTNATRGVFDGCDHVNMRGQVTVSGDCAGLSYLGGSFKEGATTALMLNDAHNVRVQEVDFDNNSGFGVWGDNGASHCVLDRLKTTRNRLELIGLTVDTSHCIILDPHAEGSGDNGVSVNGFFHRVHGGLYRRNAHAGLYLYGYGNVAVGGHAFENGTDLPITDERWGGVAIGGFWGGLGQDNIVANFYSTDDRPLEERTQYHCFTLAGAGYSVWTSGELIDGGPSNRRFRRNGFNLYETENTGPCGANPPVHTSGSASDGSLIWRYLGTFSYGTSETAGNKFIGNTARQAIGDLYRNTTVNRLNQIINESGANFWRPGELQISGQIRQRCGAYQNGDFVGFGEELGYSGRRYRCMNGGGIMSDPPVHTSGIVTGADGIAWLFVAGNQLSILMTGAGGFMSFNNCIGLNAMDNSGASSRIFAGFGNPDGQQFGKRGWVFIRLDGGLDDKVIFEKRIDDVGGNPLLGWR